MDNTPVILIADDDLDDCLIMAQTFNEMGYSSAKFFGDGTELIDYLIKEGPEAVSLIVLDLNMPRMGGGETLRKLKADTRFCKIQVIIFSTSLNETEKNLCLALGAREYLTKPSRYSEYLKTCRKFHAIALG